MLPAKYASVEKALCKDGSHWMPILPLNHPIADRGIKSVLTHQ